MNATNHWKLSAILGLYLGLSCWDLTQPGLEYDEVLFANAALGNLDRSFIAHEIKVGEFTIPIMLMSYIGALKAYVYRPILQLFPASAITVRLPVILLGMITLLVTYRLVARHGERSVALPVVWLLATDPSYVFHTRVDFGPTALMMFLKMTSLLALANFVAKENLAQLAVGSFLLGLGIFDKANFLWYVVALAVATVMVWRTEVLRYLNARNSLTCGFFVILGCLPFLYYNFATNGKTFENRLVFPEDLLGSLQTRTALLIETLNGSGLYKFANGIKPYSLIDLFTSPSLGALTPWFIASASVFVCVGRRRLRCWSAPRFGVFFALLFLLILLEIYLTHLPVGWHHFMMLWPFHLIALCSFLLQSRPQRPSSDAVPGLTRIKRPTRLPVIALATLVASNLIVDGVYLWSFSQEGGRGIFSDAIHELVTYAKERPSKRFLLMDWGFNTQMQLLSRGAIHQEEVFPRLMDEEVNETSLKELYDRAIHPSSVLVFHAGNYVVHGKPIEVFEEMLRRFGPRKEIVKTFFQRQGDPVYVLIEVRAN